MLKKSIVYSAKFSSTDSQCSWFKKVESFATTSILADICRCSERTIRDWENGIFRPRYDCVQTICRQYKIPMPTIQKVSRLEHLKLSGKKGGLAVLEKYGKLPIQEQNRKERWREWWEKTGKGSYIASHAPLKITKPKKIPDLAEFIGIMMGDGTMSTYHIGITLNAIDDAEYAIFVTKLIKKLFNVHPKIYKRKNKNAVVITVARKLLVEHLHSLGLPIGNKIKQGLDIPKWILDSPEFAKSCLRGLVDTDGSVFTHTYRSKMKIYRYKKISFTSASPTLLISVQKILTQNNIRSHISKSNLRIGSKTCVERYFSYISSNNTKHLKRIAE
jgi:hypothetical protein